MTMVWHLRGYERDTGLLGKDFPLAPVKVRAVRGVLSNRDGEAIPVDPSELTPRTADRIADAIGLPIDSDRFDYFVEAEEDWRIVAAMRESFSPRL